MSDQRDLLEPFPGKLIKQLPGTAKRPPLSYVSWTDKLQRLIQIGVPYSWTIEGIHRSGDDSEPVAVHGRLRVVMDGVERVIDGMGQGTNAKKASTDAFARACAFLGLGLHLWTKGGDKDGGYWIVTALDKQTTPNSDGPAIIRGEEAE